MSAQDDLAALLQWDTGATITPESYARLRAHPRYGEAVRRFAANMLAAGDADRTLDGILKDAGRNVGALCASYLHVTGGLTLPRLKEMCAGFGLVSAGRARALLFYMQYLGYVERSTRRRRGGPAAYPATQRFLDTWRNHQRAVLEAIEVLEPSVALVLDRFDQPGVFEAYTAELGAGFLQSVPQTDVNMAYFRIFMHRNAGIQIVHSLLVDSGEGAFPPMEPIPVSQSALARRFGVSRAHISRLLEAAAAAKLVRLEPAGSVQFEAEGRAQLDFVFATQMIRFLITVARTLKARPLILEASALYPGPMAGRPTPVETSISFGVGPAV